jgi:hypothetical protein
MPSDPSYPTGEPNDDALDLEEIIGSLPPLPPGASDDLDELIEAAIEETLFGEGGKYADLVISIKSQSEH